MPLILLAAVSLIWVFYYLGIESLLDSGWQSHWMNALRFLLGGALLAALAWGSGAGQELIAIQRHHLPRIILISWAAVGLATALLTFGQQLIASSVAGTLGALIPICTVLIGSRAAFGRQRIGGRGWLGILIGAIGVVLIAAPWSGAVNPLGVVAVVAAAALFALEAQWIGKWFSTASPLALTAALTIWTGLGFLILALPYPFQAGSWELLALVAIGSNLLGYWLFLILIARSGPIFANLNNYLIPVIALLAGVLLAGDQLSPELIAGALFCLTGAGLAGRRALSREGAAN